MGRTSKWRRAAWLTTGLILAYLLLAYVVLPAAWTHYERQPGLAGKPMVTRTAQGIPGDPLNVGLVGDRDDIARAMHAAGWFPADPLTLRSDAEIVGSVLLDRPDPTAPVSTLFLDGRHEDLAYEFPVGDNARHRHHVRLWHVMDNGAEGRPVWLGSATFDQSVGISHYTGQVTHDIAPDIDAERDFMAGTLVKADMAESLYQITGVGPTVNGRNGEGSRYWTDGEIHVVVLVPDGIPQVTPPTTVPTPAFIAAKDELWRSVADAFAK